MNLTKIIKREIFVTILTIIGIAITFFGVSYAIYFTIDEKNIGTVTFGQISFDMCLDESCSTGGTDYGTTITGEVYPMNTAEGTSQTPYLFKVSNNGNQPMRVKVYAAKEGPSTDYTNVKLAAKIQGTSTYSYANLTQDVSILLNATIPAGQTKIVEVYMWLAEQASNDMIGKTITAFINATGQYVPDDPNNLHTTDTFIANISAPMLTGQTFSYTGDYQEFEVPVSGYYFIETWGASGGTATCNDAVCGTGGKGGYSSGYLYLKNGEKIYIYVGGKGTDSSVNTATVAGGWNGGGQGTYDGNDNEASGAGGGATDIRYFGDTTPTASDLEWDSTLGLNSRIMVAGGGAGSAWYQTAGDGGGLIGGQSIGGNGATAGVIQDAQPGGQTTGYQFGKGQDGSGGGADSDGVPGGGGGYYGGQSLNTKPSSSVIENAAGGSSFISGYAGSNAITSASDRTHTNNTIHYSGKYFIDGYMKPGVNTGNGKVTIKYAGALERINTKLTGVRYIKDCIKGNTVNGWNAWIEIQAMKDGVDIAKGKTVSGITANSSSGGPLSNIVDGNIELSNWVNTSSGNTNTNECAIIDLGSIYDLDEISVWHYYDAPRVYYNNITSVSSNNSAWTELTNEIATESNLGKRVNAYREENIGYIQDGLLVWYDGITNTGTTRSTTTTTWENLAGSSYDGTIANGTWGDNYLTFNGTSSWVKIAQLNYNVFTLESVVKQNNLVSGEKILMCNYNAGGYGLHLQNGYPRVQAHISGGWNDFTSANTLDTTSIHSLSGSFDGMYFELSEDGVMSRSESFGSSALTITAPSNSTVMAVGANPAGTNAESGYLDGNMYSVRIYNRVLTNEEVLHNYQIDKERFGVE